MSRIITVISLLLFWSHSGYAQQEQDTETIKYTNPILVELKPNIPVMLTDSLSILLTGYSHKRPPYPGTSGPTKTTIQLSLSKGNNCGKIEVCRYGLQGKTEYTYAPSLWNEYEFKLKDFDFLLSFNVVISKKQDTD
ncbi:hypothetical protein [Aquimarina macrocephali]|uniref:hypothetical protein n=1 Tax=Aquimarina macrocephali TaxID=666563 RepID=UPI003F662CCC